MAGVDKIYGTRAQYEIFRKWIRENRPGYLKYLYRPKQDTPLPTTIMVIANFPESADKWLYKNCPIDFIQKRLSEQYNWPKESRLVKAVRKIAGKD